MSDAELKPKTHRRTALDAHPFRFICEICNFSTDRSFRVHEHRKLHGEPNVKILKIFKDQSIESLREGKRLSKRD